MSTPPFPSIHSRANSAAADKTAHARKARDEADRLLDEIDAMLAPAGRP